MLEFMVWGFWFVFGGYVFWFIFKAGTIQPLGSDELALMWKLHRRESGCGAPIINELLIKNSELVGFKCACGHVFLQRRLITQRIYTCANSLLPKASNTVRLSEVDEQLRDQGLRYSRIKEM
jgi:hypothetical protein